MKPGPLTDEETRLMRRHPEIGHELLSGSQNRFIQLSATIALRHQERYDGSGYPDGLAGDEIPIEARIVAVADVFDALISVRPYKRAWGFDEALDLISAQSGKLRSEEHTSELQSLMRTSYAVSCLKNKQTKAIGRAQVHNHTH